MLVHHYAAADQEAFARLAGDYNPLHMDAVYARRLLFGRPVVHGLHAAIRALDGWLALRAESIRLTELQVVFEAPIPVGATCEVVLRQKSDGGEATSPGSEPPVALAPGAMQLEIEVLCDSELAIRLRAACVKERQGRDTTRHAAPELPCIQPARGDCRRLTIDAASKASGELELCLDPALAARLFPNAVRRMPAVQLASLLCVTRLVGMECPGLDSLLYQLELDFPGPDEAEGDGLVLRYAVDQVDRRFGLTVIRVSTPFARGRVKALFRPEPCGQPAFAQLKRAVREREFAGQAALVVGGSRGLGELSAKLLAAGGAEVALTYHQGGRDARRVADDIEAGGGAARCLKLDVETDSTAAALRDAALAPSHLYYFATPPIFVARRGAFSPELFERFCRFYVSGFYQTLTACRAQNPEFARAFYPSSAALDEQPIDMGEYCAAKTAGESLCATLERSLKRLVIGRPRLPRLATDQTASLVSHDTEDPVPLLLAQLRALRDA